MTLAFFLLSCVFGWVVGNGLLALWCLRECPTGDLGSIPRSEAQRLSTQAIRVREAILCVGCDCVVASRGVCPLCGSVALLNLGKLLAGVTPEPTLGEVDDVLNRLE